MSIYLNPSFDHHEQVIYCNDHATGLKAIIGIHNTNLGPSLGGLRMYPYQSDEEALTDVLRLSRGMTYKAAMAKVPLGGGKAVIIGDPKKLANEALFRSFGRYVNSLNGRYITAEDVGTSVDFMEWISKETKHVTGIPENMGGTGDPSPTTAHGVFLAIKASQKHLTGSDDLTNVKVAVQGTGHVGYYLCQELYQHGAKLTVADVNKESANKIAEQFTAKVVAPDEIYQQEMDIFAPCALGASLNDETIPQLKCKIIVGAANNQLANEKKHGLALKKRQILYAPDYVANSGGLIRVFGELKNYSEQQIKDKTAEIYHTVLSVLATAEKHDIDTNSAANKIAESIIYKKDS